MMDEFEKELLFRISTVNLDAATNDEEFGKLKGMKIAYEIALEEYRSMTCKRERDYNEITGEYSAASYCSKCDGELTRGPFCPWCGRIVE